ncbi:glycosyltransferase family 4 protein [Limnofasciculus baicalensis]|uniref:Glycosyltransferase family 4 protein n=1 Tax=Limnofasciculus baicalensis BBK-W-15 TaxID=2699891 RepID=A0AAE3KLK4_9CYAN|nr:glycosyltransferase family 1 protein [Limnofasciculus baicalensis]MCP2727786.1 glycosyltransferase family 4 protein [Limnofasciculus baicalensis BBK-W-15]
MLKITVDATPISPKPSGVGLYVANLIHSLNSLQTQENFQLGITYQPGLKNWLRRSLEFPNSLTPYSHRYLLPFPVRITNFLLDNFPKLFPLYLEHYLDNPDIIHGTNYTVYPYQNSRKVLTIYDLTFIKYPNYIDSVVKTYSHRIKKCLQWTDLILTISESSKRDIIEYLNIDPNRIHVTPLASRYHPDIRVIPPTNSINYNFSQPYILFVSTIEPRKNITTLISAFNYLKQTHKIDHQLILIGQKGWHYQPIFTAIENSPYKHHIHHLDYLSDEVVALFYAKADVFVYPSHYEGFGLPVLEAMTLGAPVITSNTSSLPEVTGDAALLINPDDQMHLAEAILKVISDSQLRQQLIEKGKERAKLFSWERTAKETIKAYKSLLT